MKKESIIESFINSKKIILGMGILIVVISTIAISYNKRVIDKEIGKYLYELSLQSKGKVDIRVASNFTILEKITEYIKDKNLSIEEVDNYVQYLGHSYPFDWIGYSDEEGNIRNSKGEYKNLLEYSVIQNALKGKNEINDTLVNIFGEEGILYTVPCNFKNKRKGSIIGFAPKSALKRLLPTTSFNGEGFMHIINKNGDFILKSDNKNSTLEGNNFFKGLLNDFSQNDKIEKIKADIQNEKNGCSNFELNSIKYSLNYMVAENRKWYILTLVPTSAYTSQLVSYTRYNFGIIIISIIIFIILFYFIKAIEAKNEEISRIAYEDPVTKGFTSARFEIDIRKRLEKKEFQPFTFVSLDIRKFKLINESFGEIRGNFVLKHVHDCIKNIMEENESISRISSDTFNILLNSTDEEEIKYKMKQISILINEINNKIENPYYLSIDCGAYIVSNNDFNVIVIRDRANHARKSSKSSKSTSSSDLLYNCTFYNSVEIENSLKEKNMEDNMESALENNQFAVYLQPKVELKTNKIAGAEALVRWIDPKQGLIPPNDFIPLFEKNGFIVKLDIYVFEETCKIIRKWLDEGTNPIPISVNLSRVHLQNPNFLKKYKDLQEKYKIPADLLEIELTETLVFENFEQLKKIIDEIHQLGFKCSIDDFGSGYSSLNLLKEISVDILKLDRIFFNKENDKRGKSVIESIVTLAKKLNMITISEGIETISQVEFLKKINCDLVQGYVYSKPIDKELFERNFLKNKDVEIKEYKNKKE